MNPIRLPHLFHKTAALTGCIFLATFGVTRADDDGEQGGDISGSEHAEQRVLLQPGPSAPAGVSGKAELEAEDEDGTATATLSLEPKGLPDGTYTVSVTSKSDPTAAAVVLGSFEVSSIGGTGSGDGEDAQGDDNAQGDEGDHHAGRDGEADDEEVKFGEEGTPFPDGFNPLDIGTISITDATGVVDLTGDFTSLTADQMVHASVSITAGPAATNAKGHAVFSARAKRGHVRSRFVLGARSVPASATFTVNVNDAPVATVKSNRRGQVSVRAPKGLPGGQNPFQIHSITLVDSTGAHVLDVNF